MSDPFDPYGQWLAIPPGEQPPNHYRLLGVRLFETNSNVIEEAARRRLTGLQLLIIGPRGNLARQLVNEVTAARDCLIDPLRREQYDLLLRERQAALPKTSGNPLHGHMKAVLGTVGSVVTGVAVYIGAPLITELAKNQFVNAPPPADPAAAAAPQPAAEPHPLGWEFLPRHLAVHENPFFQAADGTIHCAAGENLGSLIKDGEYGDFTLKVEWRFPAGGFVSERGSGVAIRTTRPDWQLHLTEIELAPGQAGDLHLGKGTTLDGSPPPPDKPLDRPRLRDAERPIGNWNTLEVIAAADKLEIRINGQLVNQGKNHSPRVGNIALMAQGSDTEFRNFQVVALSSSALPGAPSQPTANPASPLTPSKPAQTASVTPAPSVPDKPRPRPKVDPGFKLLFNGVDLDGWVGPRKYWKVVEGTLVGNGLDEGTAIGANRLHAILSTTAHYRNFILKAKFKLTDGVTAIMFHGQSVSMKAKHMALNFDRNMIHMGELRDETKPKVRIIAKTDEQQQDALRRVINLADWNEITLAVRGPNIRCSVGGYDLWNVKDADGPKEGVISLKLAGGDTRVAFKDMQIQPLPDGK